MKPIRSINIRKGDKIICFNRCGGVEWDYMFFIVSHTSKSRDNIKDVREIEFNLSVDYDKNFKFLLVWEGKNGGNMYEGKAHNLDPVFFKPTEENDEVLHPTFIFMEIKKRT